MSRAARSVSRSGSPGPAPTRYTVPGLAGPRVMRRLSLAVASAAAGSTAAGRWGAAGSVFRPLEHELEFAGPQFYEIERRRGEQLLAARRNEDGDAFAVDYQVLLALIVEADAVDEFAVLVDLRRDAQARLVALD